MINKKHFEIDDIISIVDDNIFPNLYALILYSPTDNYTKLRPWFSCIEEGHSELMSYLFHTKTGIVITRDLNSLNTIQKCSKK